jgi:hypothetical protein
LFEQPESKRRRPLVRAGTITVRGADSRAHRKAARRFARDLVADVRPPASTACSSSPTSTRPSSRPGSTSPCGFGCRRCDLAPPFHAVLAWDGN